MSQLSSEQVKSFTILGVIFVAAAALILTIPWVWLVTVLFAFITFLMMLVILIQKPKGGGLSGAFGGAGGSSQAAFGAKTGDILTGVTVVLFALFLVTAIKMTWAINVEIDEINTQAIVAPETAPDTSAPATDEAEQTPEGTDAATESATEAAQTATETATDLAEQAGEAAEQATEQLPQNSETPAE